MNAEIYADWLCRQGQTVVRTASSYWHSPALGVYQAFPYHLLIDPSHAELQALMSDHHAVAVRYSTPTNSAIGSSSYHVVYSSGDYGFDRLTSWARKNVRRGLRLSNVGPISFARFVEEGWELRVDTLARQERSLKESQDDWKRRYSTAADLAGFEVWAAEVQNRLGATLLVFRMADWYYMVYQQCRRDYLREHVNNALSFVVTQELVRRPGVKGIFYGMESLDAPPSVDEFKFRMGYEVRTVRQCVVFNQYLAPLVNRASHLLLKVAVRIGPHSQSLAKAEGMFRLALTQKISAAAQANSALNPEPR